MRVSKLLRLLFGRISESKIFKNLDEKGTIPCNIATVERLISVNFFLSQKRRKELYRKMK